MALSKGPGDEAASDKDLAELRGELRHIVAKDGTFTEWEKRRVDALNQVLDAEPPLRNILVNLDVRQRKEISALANQQEQPPVRDEAYYAAQRKRYSDLEERHHRERDRYISDYQKAQTIRDEMQQQSREQALEQGLDDKPKLSY